MGSSFTAGNGIENDTKMTVASGQTLILNGAGLDNQGTFTLGGGTLAVGNMTSNGSFIFDSGILSATQADGTISASIVSNTPNTTININANNVSLGNAASFTGFNHQGILNVDANNITLNSAVNARLGVLTSINGGTINAPNGVALATGSNLLGHGAINAQVTGEHGAVIEADGALSLGDSASLAGFNFAGQLRTKQFGITLNSSGPVRLGSLTTLGAGANAGMLNAANGFVVDFGDAVSGFGTINSANALAQRATINGTVQGNSGAQPITLSGYIKGTGTLTNVNVTGTYSPGLSPTIVTTTNLSLASTSALVMELGGTTPGSGHDQIQDSGTLTLGGTLEVSLINSFSPLVNNSFDILNWGSLTGTFTSLSLPTLAGGLTWNTSLLYSTGVISVAAAGIAGNYNSNGTVDSGDYVVWRKYQGTTHVLPNDPTGGTIGAAQYTAWRSHFGRPAGSGTGTGINAAVPEPSTSVLLMLAAACWFLLWNGDQSNDVHFEEKMAGQYLMPEGLSIADRWPMAYVRGNHDVRGPAARSLPRFTGAPGDRYYYAFRSGPVAALVMDTGEDKPDDNVWLGGITNFAAMRREQTAWLESAINEPWFRDAPFRVLFCHIPFWFRGVDPNAIVGVCSKPCRDAWSPILERAGIKLIVSGHTHAFAWMPAKEGQPLNQLIGGGPKPEFATIIYGSATRKRLRLTMKKLDGAIVADVKFDA